MLWLWPGSAAPADQPPNARVLAAVATFSAPASRRLTEDLHGVCGGDLVCVSRRLAAVDARVRLQPVETPSTDAIRWVTTRPSVGTVRRLADGRTVIVLDGFGRTVLGELRAVAAGLAAPGDLLLDLRDNRGGDLGRMLKVAGMFVHDKKMTLKLIDINGIREIEVPRSDTAFHTNRLSLLVGPKTASSAEVLAALLRRYAGAELVGERTAGKDYVTRVVAIDQRWRLLIPAERLEVPGEALAGGLLPDRPLPAHLAAHVAAGP